MHRTSAKKQAAFVVALVLIAVFVGCFSTLSAQELREGVWSLEKGSISANPTAFFGQKGVESPINQPPPRANAASWLDEHGDLWIFGGRGYIKTELIDLGEGLLNDLWKFDADQNLWIWVSGTDRLDEPSTFDHPGARTESVAWLDGDQNFWLYGGLGFNQEGERRLLNDLWMWDGSSWSLIEGSLAGGQAPSEENGPGARRGASGWVDQYGRFWLFGGFGTGGRYNDLWYWSDGSWNLAGGSLSANQTGSYENDPWPGARMWASVWVDRDFGVWLFGGNGLGESSSNGMLNDLWKLDLDLKQWAFVAGRKTSNHGGVFGPKTEFDPRYVPPSRANSSFWIDQNERLWLFGGQGVEGTRNDLWVFDPDQNAWAWLEGSSQINQVFTAEDELYPGSLLGAIAHYVNADSTAYVYGGQQQDVFYSSMLRYTSLDTPPPPVRLAWDFIPDGAAVDTIVLGEESITQQAVEISLVEGLQPVCFQAIPKFESEATDLVAVSGQDTIAYSTLEKEVLFQQAWQIEHQTGSRWRRFWDEQQGVYVLGVAEAGGTYEANSSSLLKSPMIYPDQFMGESLKWSMDVKLDYEQGFDNFRVVLFVDGEELSRLSAEGYGWSVNGNWQEVEVDLGFWRQAQQLQLGFIFESDERNQIGTGVTIANPAVIVERQPIEVQSSFSCVDQSNAKDSLLLILKHEHLLANKEYEVRLEGQIFAQNVADALPTRSWTFSTTQVSDEELSTVELIQPQADARVSPDSVLFVWRSLSGATLYEFELWQNQEKVQQQSVQDTSIVVESSLAFNTSFAWRVRARHESTVSEWTSFRVFRTQEEHQEETLQRPTLLSPENGIIIQNDRVNFSWTSVEQAQNYELHLSVDEAFNTFDRFVFSTSSALNIPIEVNKIYYWRVRARNENMMSDWSDTHQFESIYQVFGSPLQQVLPATADPFDPLNYRLVSLPGGYNSLTVAQIFEGAGQLGKDWMVYEDNGALQNYFISQQQEPLNFRPGKAFWYVSAREVPFNDQWLLTPQINANYEAEIPLRAGWNLIGSPLHRAHFNWQDIQAYNGISDPIWNFDQGTWKLPNTLEPFLGYYFFNSARLQRLRLPLRAASNSSISSNKVEIEGFRFTLRSANNEQLDAWWIMGASDSPAPYTDDAKRVLWLANANESADQSTRKSRLWRKQLSMNQQREGVCIDIHVKQQYAGQLVVETVGESQPWSEQQHWRLISAGNYIDLQDGRVDLSAGRHQLTFCIHEQAGEDLESEVEQPTRFGLQRIYPNPFNAGTQIRFHLENAAMIELEVWDMLGRKVAQLAEGVLPAGSHQRGWSATGVPSGVYLVRLVNRSNGSVSSQRVSVVK